MDISGIVMDGAIYFVGGLAGSVVLSMVVIEGLTNAYAMGGITGSTDIGQGEINLINITKIDDPVDVANGNFSYEKQDMFISSRGLSLELKRFYNSLDEYEDKCGYKIDDYEKYKK